MVFFDFDIIFFFFSFPLPFLHFDGKTITHNALMLLILFAVQSFPQCHQ